MAWSNEDLVRMVSARAPGYLDGRPRSGRVLDAMRAVDRRLFLPAEAAGQAYMDAPAPIGHGQTCSEPSMVAFMLDVLGIGPGMRVLEIGAGSGYAAAVAARLAAPGGLVLAAEIEPGLAALARRNLDSACVAGVEVLAADGSRGLPGRAPFDRIFLSAGVRPGGSFTPDLLLAQLGEEGVLLYPEARGSLRLLRLSEGRVEREAWQGVAFVPLRGEGS